jgi:esterase/lipase superfamily enzyme
MVFAFVRNLFRSPARRVLFVHGFNNSPQQIAAREAAIREHLPPNLELSTHRWHSVAGLVHRAGLPEHYSALLYPLDNLLTKASVGRQLNLSDSIFSRGKEKFAVVAHSRGNAVVVHWLLNNPSQLDRIHRFAMLHPDVDAATFGKLPEAFRHNNVKVYDTKGDFATTVSGFVDGSRDLSPHVKHHDRILFSVSHNHWLDRPKALQEVLKWVAS